MKVSELLNHDSSFDDGSWVDLREFSPHRDLRKVRVRVRPSDHPKYRAAYNAGLQPHLRAVRLGKLRQEVIDRITNSAVAKQLLMDWSGIEDTEGNPLPFDRKIVEGWAELDPQPDKVIRFFSAVKDAADYLAAGGAEDLEDLGNS